MASGMEMMLKSMGFNVENFKAQITEVKESLDKRLAIFDAKLDYITRQNSTIINLLDKQPELSASTQQRISAALDSGSDPSQHGIKVDPNEVSFEELELRAQQGNQHAQG